jgi:hypothetical protein
MIEASEKEKLTVKWTVAKFNVGGKHKVYDILKAILEIRNQWLNCSKFSMKRKLRETWNECSETVWECFVSVRGRKLPIFWTRLQEYAKEMGKQLDRGEFRASNGWLESFRKRHQIVFNEYSTFTLAVLISIELNGTACVQSDWGNVCVNVNFILYIVPLYYCLQWTHSF